MNNHKKYTNIAFAALQNDTNWREQKRPIKIKGEGTPGKFYFRISNPNYQLVEITRENAYHHYLLCFESIA
jgi:hypothetical protein